MLAVLGAALVSGPRAAGVEPPARSTAVRIFLPFAPDGRLRAGLAVAKRLPGACFAASLATQGRPDAWRCMSGNAIFDPCFEGHTGGGEVLACVTSPWSSHVAMLTPTRDLPRGQANKGALLDALPWAVELTDGTRCGFLTGATAGAAGLRVNYGCGGAMYLLGPVDRAGPRWRVFADSGSRLAAERVEIAVAWF